MKMGVPVMVVSVDAEDRRERERERMFLLVRSVLHPPPRKRITTQH
jgi:hypothetical protein